MGNANAKVTMIEYASVTCPHCARVNEDVIQPFKAKYVDTGKVSYEFREFLTSPANIAAAGVLVARCAGKDKYFSVIDALFHSQQEMFSGGDVRGILLRIGRGAGLSDDKITACITDEKALSALQDRIDRNGKADNVTGTPTFIVNGKKLDGQTLAGTVYAGGEITLAQLEAAVQPLLK